MVNSYIMPMQETNSWENNEYVLLKSSDEVEKLGGLINHTGF